MIRLLRELLNEVPRGRGRFALSVLLAAFASGASVALMGVSAWLLSRAAEHPPVLYLEAAAVGVRFFGIARGVFRYLERLVGHDLALRMQGALRLRSYQTLSRTTLLGRRRGDLLTRMVADVEAIQDVVVRVAVPFCSASLVILGTTAMLTMFSPASAAALLGTALLGGILMPWLAQRMSLEVDRDAAPARGELSNTVDQISHAAADLVAYGLTDEALERLAGADNRLRTAEARAAWVRGLASAGQMIAAGLAVVTALVIGSQAVASGDMLARNLAVLVLTPLALHEVLATLTQSAQTMTRARSSLARVLATLEEPVVGAGDRDNQTDSETTPTLSVRQADLGWPGSEPVLRDVNLHLTSGERVAIVGSSGVGKTTLAATAMGLIEPLAGSVELRGTAAYLAQDAHIFSTSVSENVRIGKRDASDTEVSEALRQAGLPLDPDRLLGEQGRTLSGGEVRRLALARILVGRGGPRLMILDEPTEHLDNETAENLMRDLWAATADDAVMVVTHDSQVVSNCTRTVELTAPLMTR